MNIINQKGKRVSTAGSQQGNVEFGCNECEAVYGNRKGLSGHIKSVHRGVKYDCNQCNSIFTQRSNLTTHI